MSDPKHLKLLIGLFCISILLSIPSIVRIPRMVPFLQSEVRTAAPKALEQLRKQGLWLVNVDLLSIEQKHTEICFEWDHRYRSRTRVDDSEFITTCIE